MKEDDTLEISKSQRKREAHELLDVARQLIAMPDTRLKTMPLDDDLRSEIDFARSIRSHGARKRQLMTIGKMLRKRDTEELLQAIHELDQKNRQQIARHHHIEAWRDKLMEDNDQVLFRLLEQSPTLNAQTLRQLIRNARKGTLQGKPPAALRKLFKLLREADKQNPLPPL